ncbi:restriction endonuclease subunit S [Bacillus paramycoides]|uniref:restriction endonuclease subunit S n=1 Tax=Bacillus paramycoides TaxID=2026194 RepID=UPI0011A52DC1|nr:restriction endonuclease subunit S [Bacillus paramycoides]
MEFEVIPFEGLFSLPLKNGLSKPKKVRGEGYPMVNMGEIFAHDRIRDIEMDLVPMNEREMATSYLQKNDLLFARQSLTLEGAGKCSIFLGESTETTYESHLIRVRLDNNKCNPLFYYYYFKSPMGKWKIGNIVEQVAAAGIRGSDLKKLKIPYFPYEFQNKIAKTLNYIDEKIELNQKLVSNLEQLSQTLFKHWFIDFEFPNEQGQPYKSSGGEMVESELGKIPKNWTVITIKDVCDANKGSLSKKDNWSYINYLDTSNITNNSIENIQFIDATKNKIPSRAKRKIQPNDIVYSTVRPNQHHYGIIKEPTENMIASTGFTVLRSKGVYPNDLIYLWLTQKEVTDNLQAIAEQSTSAYPSIKADDILSMKILLPQKKELAALAEIIEVQNKMIWNKLQENKKLSELRDTLLPKLLSGDIKIPDEVVVD